VNTQLVLVRGTQGSGKTLLSNRLGLMLGWPVIHREDFRLAAAASLGRTEIEPKGVEARQAVESFFRELSQLVTRGTSVVADSTFPSGVCEGDLASLMAVSDLGAVHCTVPREVVIERCRQRPESSTLIDVLKRRDEVAWRRFDDPLRSSIPQWRVDTSDGYKPTIEEVASWVRSGFRAEA
jgi:predicted kinase